ncbi:MAG: tRNA 2-thiouridine(34) synthase MnmA [Gemmatales bacterium]|nr:tRNA 2-thiouridine(34) synthase MnmA [Gemmatales bacterium]MDW8387992.1 tRNA 2-thiouridine(34) synthase MnmA [Gemmatales bacterium]
MARVVVAMSGGVDSSVAALLLKRAGHEVIGVFMRTGVQHEGDACEPRHKQGCCSALDAQDARRVADRLDIPFYAFDYAEEFDRIITYFADEYASGRTPNPCVVCNTWLKFGKLWHQARRLGADCIATGHYARIVQNGGSYELHRAVDLDKDQSYVLFGLRVEILSNLLLTVGEFTKTQIRALAREANLPVSEKPDSQEICFVPAGRYVEVVRKRRPDLGRKGVFLDRDGNVLGEHPGIENFTVGQRKGLGIATGSRRFVLEIIPSRDAVVLGSREDCLVSGLLAERVNWLIPPPSELVRCEVKIRYRSRPAQAWVKPLAADTAEVRFDEPQMAVTPGQAAVFYDGSRVLGGGWIAKPLRHHATGIEEPAYSSGSPSSVGE